MDKITSNYDIYANRARNVLCDTQVAGRYACQKEDERKIILDIIKKLEISSSDNLLEIGCGTGNLSVPLSFLVNRVVGIDNPSAIDRMLNRVNSDSLEGIRANFLTYDINGLCKFEKILIYSVLHYLTDEKSIYSFVDKALSLLNESGMLLLGDIPNTTLKNSFSKSSNGKKFIRQWEKRVANDSSIAFDQHVHSYEFNDESIFELVQHIKAKGYKAYVVPQPSDLPFGNTREDIIVSTF